MHRSYLFAPGHSEKLLSRVFSAGADAVILDLEDAVPPQAKEQARAMVTDVLRERTAWVRINAVRTGLAEADLRAVAGLAAGIRIPKVESADDVRWVRDRAPGTPLICAIETARGLLAAPEIALADGVRHLSLGGVDLRRDLGAAEGDLYTLYARSHLVVASRAAGLEAPIDSVYPRIDDDDGLRQQAEFARSLGFFGKSVIHPRQLPVIHNVFTPSADELAWARTVLDAFDAAGGGAVKLPDGEFVDLPVADRARRLLGLAGQLAAPPRPTSAWPGETSGLGDAAGPDSGHWPEPAVTLGTALCRHPSSSGRQNACWVSASPGSPSNTRQSTDPGPSARWWPSGRPLPRRTNPPGHQVPDLRRGTPPPTVRSGK